MPALTSITLVDDQVADHVYVPQGKAGPELTEFAAPGGATPLSDETLTFRFSRATAQRPTDRVNCGIGIPIYYTDSDGNEAVDDTFRWRIEGVSPQKSTTAQRTTAHSLLAALVASDEFKSYFINRSPFYG
mgnify:CR=1 FL=1